MGLDRARGIALLSAYFPADGRPIGQGMIAFDHIAKDYSNIGTTCGYPTHWMLWRLGCTEESLVNRYEPDTNFTYASSENLSKIAASHAFVRVDNKTNREMFLSGAIGPKPGDTIFISGGKKTVEKDVVNKDGTKTHVKTEKWDEHVYQVFAYKSGAAKDKLLWRVVNSGLGEEGHQSARIMDERGVRYSGGEWYDTYDSRKLLGWLDIDKLSGGAAPKSPKSDPLAAHCFYPSQGPPTPDNVIGVWKISTGEYYMFYKGHRVFRLASNNLKMIMETGYWYPLMGKIHISWECLREEVFLIRGDSAEGRSGSGDYTALKTITTDHVMSTFHENRGNQVNEKTRLRV